LVGAQRRSNPAPPERGRYARRWIASFLPMTDQQITDQQMPSLQVNPGTVRQRLSALMLRFFFLSKTQVFSIRSLRALNETLKDRIREVFSIYFSN
jgi:hypothetical protein